MTLFIGTSTDTLVPLAVDGYTAARSSRNVIHEVVGTNLPAITMRPAGLRTGTLRLLTYNLLVATSWQNLLSLGEVFTMADDDLPSIEMSFVTSGAIRVELDDETREYCWVEFEFQEV